MILKKSLYACLATNVSSTCDWNTKLGNIMGQRIIPQQKDPCIYAMS
jgi:hypothetical protein